MFNSLRGRLWLTNIITVAVMILVIILSINFFALYEFNAYKVKNLEKTYNDIYGIIAEQYIGNVWDVWLLEEVGGDILENQKILIALYDSTGQSLYDSAIINSAALSGVTAQRNWLNWMGHWCDWGRNPYNEDTAFTTTAERIQGYNEKQYEVWSEGRNVGTIVLASTEQYDTNDIMYLHRITQVIMIVGALAMGLTILLSNLFSRKISKQITNITNTASDIAQGRYGAALNERTKISELRSLILALNNLSGNLAHHETLRKRLTQDMAHELRTPIATIQGNLEAVLDGVWEMDEEKIKTLYDEVQRLSRLVEDMYNISKYENTVLNKSLFDIGKLLHSVLNQFEGALHDKKLKVEIHAESAVVYADKDKLIQVFINLLSNAIKFTPENGNIQIDAISVNNGHELCVSVMDSGIGIADEDIPYIFERFYRADKSRNRKNGGAGIGLSVVKAVVEAHGGSILVNSKKGEFTKFAVTLPCPNNQ